MLQKIINMKLKLKNIASLVYMVKPLKSYNYSKGKSQSTRGNYCITA